MFSSHTKTLFYYKLKADTKVSKGGDAGKGGARGNNGNYGKGIVMHSNYGRIIIQQSGTSTSLNFSNIKNNGTPGKGGSYGELFFKFMEETMVITDKYDYINNYFGREYLKKASLRNVKDGDLPLNQNYLNIKSPIENKFSFYTFIKNKILEFFDSDKIFNNENEIRKIISTIVHE